MFFYKKIVNTEEKKRLASNFFSLAVLQGSNYILPLITLPYLLRVLGVEIFGLLAFATATVAYFNIMTEYGFNLTATRDVSIYRGDNQKISEIFSSVMIIKVIIMVISFFLLSVIVFSIEKFSKDWLIYFLSFGTVLGQVLFPIWLFQGLEKMKYVTYLNIFAKLIFTITIFIFVNEKRDYYLVPLLTSIGLIFSGICSLILIKKYFNVNFNWQKKEVIKMYLVDGWHLFISNLAVSLYTVSAVFILGIFTNNIMVGYFSAADRIVQAFKGLTMPITQAIFPYISRKVTISKRDGLNFIKKITFLIAIFTGSISLFIYIFAGFLVNLVVGSQYEESILLLKLMSVLPFFIGLSNVFGIQTMINFDRKKPFSAILIIGSLLSFILSLLLVPIYQYVGTAISVVLVEGFMTITMFMYLQLNGLKIIGKNTL
ncbi:flippase [Shewanella oncorhynchi]|uniref:flippase n=1 Tax=Shewanella oncorhynchi TaxID=2726434 RepID=UPI003D7AA17C